MGRPVPHPAKAMIVSSGRYIYEVAAEVGINPSSLGDILNRRQRVPPGLGEKLAVVLGVDPSVLFDSEGTAA